MCVCVCVCVCVCACVCVSMCVRVFAQRQNDIETNKHKPSCAPATSADGVIRSPACQTWKVSNFSNLCTWGKGATRVRKVRKSESLKCLKNSQSPSFFATRRGYNSRNVGKPGSSVRLSSPTFRAGWGSTEKSHKSRKLIRFEKLTKYMQRKKTWKAWMA